MRYFNFVAYYSFKKYGRGTGPVFIDYINCTGGEWSLWGSCTRFTHYYGCSHDDDIGVQCKPGKITYFVVCKIHFCV